MHEITIKARSHLKVNKCERAFKVALGSALPCRRLAAVAKVQGDRDTTLGCSPAYPSSVEIFTVFLRGEICFARSPLYETVPKRNSSTKLNCFSSPTNCPVRGKVRDTGEIVQLSEPHNHLPEFEGHGASVMRSRAKWIRKLKNNLHMDPVDAILDERAE